ncbi:DUF389 domain-containing protein [Rhodococcoides trifolii]|uniref:DUF389 domain-containing protein n=1 Tax=Rhodococcoides trifolii TaxID=908250 RepID=UPI00166F579A|nr:DUF389 domain-containing protein [Rhodococcus trifolii]
MQHIRVLTPPDSTDRVVEILRGCVGVAHLMLFRGAAIEPAGDVVEADVTRESSNEVLDALRTLGLVQSGAITVTTIAATLSERADRAERAAPGDPDDAIVWDELLVRTKEESTLNITFTSFLTIACLLAAVGVITDSPVTIVGAMVVGPEFGPLAALAVGLVLRRSRLVKRSSIALVVGFPLAMAVTAIFALLAEIFGWFQYSTIDDLQQVDFIYSVGPASLVVAVLAGAAGMLALLSSKSAALVGVFISVTTVPAAGFAVVAAMVGSWRIAALSVGQLAINLVGIVLSAAVVLMIRRRVAPT